MRIRPTRAADIADLSLVLEETELFPADLLPDMLSDFLSGDKDANIWLTCEADRSAIGFCYARPEELTQGTWNMLAIAVLPAAQGKGAGRAIVETLEAELKKHGNRVLIADTSGTDQFTATRAFYLKNGYTQEARIRDFWAEGDDKIVFWKKLK